MRTVLLPRCEVAIAPVDVRAPATTLPLTKRPCRASKAIAELPPRLRPRDVLLTTAGARTARVTVEEAAKLAAVSFGALFSAFH